MNQEGKVRVRYNFCQQATHKMLDRTSDSSGHSAKGTLIFASAVPHLGYRATLMTNGSQIIRQQIEMDSALTTLP